MVLAGCTGTTGWIREDNGQQQRADQRTLHVRKATQAEPDQPALYQALNLNPAPGGIRKMIV